MPCILRYLPDVKVRDLPKLNRTTQDFPCLRHHHNGDLEVLWGATYHIVVLFLELVFGFQPPDVSGMSFIPGLLDEGYLNGRD